MTLKDYHKFTLGASDHLTRCRVLWGGSEVLNDYLAVWAISGRISKSVRPDTMKNMTS